MFRLAALFGVAVLFFAKEGLLMEFFSKPFVAMHAKFFIGVGLLLGVCGIWAMWNSRRQYLKLKKNASEE